MTAIKEIESLINQTFSLSLEELDGIYNDKNKSYRQEAEQEAIELYQSPKNRDENGRPRQSLMEKVNNCKRGMLAELALRETFPTLVPVTIENLEKYADPGWIALSKSLAQAAKYHDLIDTETGEVYEVKFWSIWAWRAKLEKWKTEHWGIENFSHHIVIFCELSDGNVCIVEVKTWAGAPTSDAKRVNVPAREIQVFQNGSSFTVLAPKLAEIVKDPYTIMSFVDDGKVIVKKPASWFIANKRISKRGAAVGGYYVFRSQLFD
jgi:hypothetical protein